VRLLCKNFKIKIWTGKYTRDLLSHCVIWKLVGKKRESSNFETYCLKSADASAPMRQNYRCSNVLMLIKAYTPLSSPNRLTWVRVPPCVVGCRHVCSVSIVYSPVCEIVVAVQGCNQKFFGVFSSAPFVSFLSFIFLSLTPPQSGRYAKGFGGTLLAPSSGGNDSSAANTSLCSLVRAQGTCPLSDGCRCRPISAKRHLKIEANVAVSERIVCHCVVAY